MSIKVLIAPDKFKGSLSAQAVGEAIHNGLLDADPLIACEVVPLADGGEGTVDVLTRNSMGTFYEVRARDPLFHDITASYGVSRDGGTAFIEMASASGLGLVPPRLRNPLHTTTLGTGDLIRDALDRGVRNICVGIGGSATNDGGMGAMIALGVSFYDEHGVALEGRGESLPKIQGLDISHMHPGMREASFTIFCDVDNPLHGARGAARVFGPQKGATPDIVTTLDNGLRHYETILQRYGYVGTNFPGAGAGGGMPVSLAVFSQAVVRSGIEFIIEFVGLDRKVSEADLVITGEGRLDEQTLSGKVVKGVASLASRHAKPLVIVAGSASLDETGIYNLGARRLITLVDDKISTEEAITRAYELIRQRVRENFLNITDTR